MQLKYIFLLAILLAGNAFGYECKPQSLKEKISSNKIKAYQELAKIPRQNVVGALLDEVTKKGMNAKKAAWYLDYLENTEQNQDQQAFFKLLEASVGPGSSTPKSLKLNEVCEIMEKVNKL